MPCTSDDQCFLCGIPIVYERSRRYQSVEKIRLLLKSRCIATPFAYQTLLHASDVQAREPICIPCVNWKRRLEGGHQRKVYLQVFLACFCEFSSQSNPDSQVDQTILYLLHPGRVHEPDQRCVERLLRALQSPLNRVRGAIPLPALTILGNLDRHDIPSITRAWWDYNGRTPFFRHSQTARLVRALRK